MKIFFRLLVLPMALFTLFNASSVQAAADNVLLDTTGVIQSAAVEYGTVSDVTYGLEATGSGLGDVTWAALGVPGGVSVSFSDNPSSGAGVWETTLTLTSNDSLDPGTYVITITADGDGAGAVASDTISYTIDPRSISSSGILIDDKEYDGTTAATTTGTLTELINSDVVSVGAVFVDKNVGTTKDTILTLGDADAAKYVLTDSVTGVVTQKNVSILTGDFATNGRKYDGTTVAELRPAPNSLTLDGVVLGDDVTIVGGSGEFADKHVGSNKVVTFSGFITGSTDGGNYNLTNQPADETQNINVKNITVRPVNDTKVYDGATSSALVPTVTTGFVAAGDTAFFTQAFGSSTVGTGKLIVSSGTIDDGNGGANYDITHKSRTGSEITPLALTVVGLPVNTKFYDKTTTATLGVGGTLSGVFGTDVVSPVFTGATATFDTSDAGFGKDVTVSGITLDGTDALNYSVNQPDLTGTIAPRPISVTAVSASKVYDATTTASGVPNLTSGTIVVGDSAIFTQVFATKDAGISKTLNPIATISDGNGGDNYDVTGIADTTGVITPLTLTVTATSSDKVYDGNTNATATFSDDRLVGDVFTISADANFSDKNVGTGKTVNVTNITLSGTDASNYVPNSTTTTTADITVRTLVVTIEGIDKSYDGTRDADILISDDRVLGDDLTVVHPTTGSNRPRFGGSHVGASKTVTVRNVSLTGSSSANYVLAATTLTDDDVAVTPALLTVAFIADDKTYDASTTAAISSSSISTALFGSDVVTLTPGSATFADKNVGTDKVVTGSGFVLGGADSSDYSIATITSATADITPLTLTVTATSSDKVYDGNTNATATFSDDRLVGDVFTISADANFSDKNVGTGKTVNVTNIILTGTDANNYTPNSTTTTTADITVRTLVVTVSGVNKVSDKTTAATVIFSDDRVLGDVFTISADANFTDKNVGTGKTVNVTNITLSGTDASNYVPNSNTAITTADINKRSSGGTARIMGVSNGQVLGVSTTNTSSTDLNKATTTATTTAAIATSTATTTVSTSTHFFTSDLFFGMSNEDVSALHQILIDQGYLQIPAPTGYFGPLTLAAVKLYQAANGIITTGYVGPLTRGALNSGQLSR